MKMNLGEPVELIKATRSNLVHELMTYLYGTAWLSTYVSHMRNINTSAEGNIREVIEGSQVTRIT